MVETVCDEFTTEAMAGGDVATLETTAITVPEKMEETPAEDQCEESDGDELVGTNEAVAPTAADRKARRGRLKHPHSCRRVTRLTHSVYRGSFSARKVSAVIIARN